jgi:hypothetical protein
MEQRFQAAGAFADKVATLVAALKKHGVDTTRLERALEAFRTHMADSHRQWEEARDLLAAHAGFDRDGHVTDAAQARTTAWQAHMHLMRARIQAERALRELHAVLATYPRPER